MSDTTTTEDMGTGDLGGSQEMMRGAPVRSARAITRTRVLSPDYTSHPNDRHGMNLGSAEKALDLYGGDGDENSNDSSEGPDSAD